MSVGMTAGARVGSFIALSGGIQNIRGDGSVCHESFCAFSFIPKIKIPWRCLPWPSLPSAFGAAGCDKLKARDLLNKGVAAYRDGKFDQSIEDFKDAKDLDPTLTNARLYLATAYATQYIPGAPSDENIRMGKSAVKEFQDVLTADPNNISAIDGIGSILYNMAGTPYSQQMFEESKTYHMKHIALKPEDPEPYYWIGVIDWTLSYRSNLEMRGKWRLAHLTAKTSEGRRSDAARRSRRLHQGQRPDDRRGHHQPAEKPSSFAPITTTPWPT